MRCFLLFVVLSVILFCPTASFASEDMEEFVFDGDTFDTGIEYGDTTVEVVEENVVPPNETLETPKVDSVEIEQQSEDFRPDIQDENTIEEKAENNISATTENKNSEQQSTSEHALTEAIKNDEQAQKPNLPLLGNDTTWVDKLISKQKTDASQDTSSLETMVENAKTMSKSSSNRSNVSVFDISGVMLRMSLKQVDSTLKNRLFKKVMSKYQIPNFIKWRNEEFCRNSGVVGYERIEACIAQKAKKDKHQYVQETKYIKYDTKEEISVFFTSNFTDNKVYKVTYKSQAANIAGNSPKSVYLRNIKIYDFWKKINQKYGAPDDKETVTWGLGDNKPFMKASTGYLMMEDPMLKELDYTRMSREDQRYMNTDLYSF
ncbi:MAG: hypothetical protein E7019_06895 [Alphaproteobacteria bacterium]|nr:hypothetical protein [Alphaproteobacteria bacterium]